MRTRVDRPLVRICPHEFWTEHHTFKGIGASIAAGVASILSGRRKRLRCEASRRIARLL